MSRQINIARGAVDTPTHPGRETMARQPDDSSSVPLTTRPSWIPRDRGGPRAPSRLGFTLIELVVVIVIIGIIAAIAMPSYQGLRERAQVAGAIAEVANLQQEIVEFRLLNNRLPTDLGEIGRDLDLDPWGRPYVYADHAAISDAQKRKDRFMVIVNTDYDLYSQGADGASAPPFTDATARDDIVRANDGGFIGLAEIF